MKIGFTGSRHGIMSNYMHQFLRGIKGVGPNLYGHGDCVGADKEFHDMVTETCDTCVVLFPSSIPYSTDEI